MAGVRDEIYHTDLSCGSQYSTIVQGWIVTTLASGRKLATTKRRNDA